MFFQSASPVIATSGNGPPITDGDAAGVAGPVASCALVWVKARSYSSRTVASNSRPYQRLMFAETYPSSCISACSEQPAFKLVESNVPTLRMPPVDQGQVDPHRRRAQRAEERKRRGRLIFSVAPDAIIWHGMPPNWLQLRSVQCNNGIYRLVRMCVTRETPTDLDPVQISTSQVGSVHGSCRMMRPMQFCPFPGLWRRRA